MFVSCSPPITPTHPHIFLFLPPLSLLPLSLSLVLSLSDQGCRSFHWHSLSCGKFCCVDYAHASQRGSHGRSSTNGDGHIPQHQGESRFLCSLHSMSFAPSCCVYVCSCAHEFLNKSMEGMPVVRRELSPFFSPYLGPHVSHFLLRILANAKVGFSFSFSLVLLHSHTPCHIPYSVLPLPNPPPFFFTLICLSFFLSFFAPHFVLFLLSSVDLMLFLATGSI